MTIDNAGDCVAVTLAVDGGEVVSGPEGSVPVAVAESLIDPLLRSACVTVYVATNVADWPTTSDVDEPEHEPPGVANDTHVGTDAAPAGGVGVSVTCTFVRGVWPVLWTVKAYVTV